MVHFQYCIICGKSVLCFVYFMWLWFLKVNINSMNSMTQRYIHVSVLLNYLCQYENGNITLQKYIYKIYPLHVTKLCKSLSVFHYKFP